MEGIGIGLGIVAIAIAYILILSAFAAAAARGKHSVVCPADGRTAMVRCRAVDGASGVFTGAPPHIARCDRWPERAGCAEACVRQLTAPPTVEQVQLAVRRDHG
jgi:hypothetical protein